METIGDYLKQMREQRGLTVEEVSSQTRISLRMLRALEANDFSQIPSEVFARGFVRSYALYLGLNEGDVFRKFRELASTLYAEIPVAEASWKLPARSPARKKWGQKLGFGATLVGVAVLVMIFFQGRSRLSPVSPVQDSVPTQRADSGHEEIAYPIEGREEKTLPSPLELSKSVSEPPLPPVRGLQAEAEGLTLAVEAAEQCWILAQIDEQVVKEVLLQPGEKIRWKANTKFLLTLGNAGGVKLEFNGKTLDPLGPTGKVVRNLILTR